MFILLYIKKNLLSIKATSIFNVSNYVKSWEVFCYHWRGKGIIFTHKSLLKRLSAVIQPSPVRKLWQTEANLFTDTLKVSKRAEPALAVCIQHDNGTFSSSINSNGGWAALRCQMSYSLEEREAFNTHTHIPYHLSHGVDFKESQLPSKELELVARDHVG